jgi:hypothetical protein
MAGRTRSHSEKRWQLLPDTVIRCNATRPTGSRCKREAEDGAVVCDQHGGAAPQVRKRAAERLVMTADQAAQMLVKMMEDTEVPFRVRAKIAQDLLDRAGVSGVPPSFRTADRLRSIPERRGIHVSETSEVFAGVS